LAAVGLCELLGIAANSLWRHAILGFFTGGGVGSGLVALNILTKKHSKEGHGSN